MVAIWINPARSFLYYKPSSHYLTVADLLVFRNKKLQWTREVDQLWDHFVLHHRCYFVLVFSSSCCRWAYSKKLSKTFCIKYRSVKSIYLHIFFSEKLCFVQPNFFSRVEFTPSAAPQCPFLKKTFLFNFLASFILVLRFKALLIIVYYFPYMFYCFYCCCKALLNFNHTDRR